MSQYATVSEFRLYGLPAQATVGVSDADLLSRIDSASAEADSYLRSRYTMPISSWGKDLSKAVCVIAAADIMAVRGYSPDGRDELIEQRASASRKWLRDVQDGKADPGLVDATPTTTIAGPRLYCLDPRGW